MAVVTRWTPDLASIQAIGSMTLSKIFVQILMGMSVLNNRVRMACSALRAFTSNAFIAKLKFPVELTPDQDNYIVKHVEVWCCLK